MSDFEAHDDLSGNDARHVLRVACPGQAHRTGGTCLVCDPETDGTIEVFLTGADVEAIRRVARGLRVDASLALRLRSLRLVEEIAGCTVVVGDGRRFIEPDAAQAQ